MLLLRPPTPLSLPLTGPSVFMAGSIDLGKSVDWQSALSASLADCPGTLLNPRRTEWDASWRGEADFAPFREQVEWELAAMEAADRIAFYFAPDSQAPVTLMELGLAARTGKAVVCCPAGYWRKGNVDVVCAKYGVPTVSSLEALAQFLRAYVDQARVASGRGLVR